MRVCTNCFRCFDDDVERCTDSEHLELTSARHGSCESIPGYKLEHQIEQGSNWTLFRARQIEFGHSCLIRVLTVNGQIRESFLSDAKAAVTFFNSNVTDIYEAGALDSGELFVVYEDAREQTLRDLLNDVGIPQLLTSVQIIRQTAEAVHALHLAGILHRSIKPENILLTSDAEHRLVVKVQNPDLGGVLEQSIVSNKFSIDSSIDKIRYFAPELFSSGSPSPQTDIYSLGIVFYEMLAGAPPFDATTASGLIEQHRHRTPAQVNINSFDLRMLITHSLMASLNKLPNARQTSANAFARQLRHVEQLATHSPTPPPAVADEPIPQAPPIAPGTGTPIRKIHVPETIDLDQTLLPQHPRPIEPVPSPEDAPAVAIVETEKSALPHPMPAIAQSTGIHTKRSENQLAVNQTFVKQRVGDPLPLNKPSAASLLPPSVLRSRRRRAHHLSALAVQMNDDHNGPESLPIQSTIEAVPPAANLGSSATALQPRKIEWVEPLDDVPSFDDANAALVSENISNESVAVAHDSAPLAEIPHEPTLQPKKIEWSQSDDDIPSLEDVHAVLLKEQIPIEPITIAAQNFEASTVASGQPRKIELMDLEDDIPTLDEVQAVLEEQPFVAPAAAQPSYESEYQPAPVTNKLVLPQIDYEIPSMEEVDAVARKESVPILNESVPFYQAMTTTGPPVQKAADPIQHNTIVAFQYDDRDEITLVSPHRNLIRIDLDEPVRTTRPLSVVLNGEIQRNDVEYVPTIIGSSRFARAKSLRMPAPSMVAYARPSFLNEPLVYRSTMVAGGIAIFVLVSLIASFVITDSVMSSQIKETETVRTTAKEEPVVKFPQPRVAEPTSRETVEKSVANKNSTVENSVKEETKKTSTADSEDRSAPAPKIVEKEQSRKVEPMEKVKPQPSTAAVSTDKGKVKTKAEPERRLPTKNSGFATRPRVVSP